MQAARRALVADSSEVALASRSEAIVERLVDVDGWSDVRRLIAYRSLPGEVDTTDLLEWCDRHGVEVCLPDPTPTATPPRPASWADAIVVPGLAFTPAGHRIGRGGGWYDRFLAARSPNALVIGLVFREFVVDELPTEPHDVGVDCVVSDDAAWWCA